MLFLIAAFLLHSAPAPRVSVAIGANHGLAEEPPLRFADQDAEHIDSVMRELGGVSARNAYLLRDAGAIKIWALIERVLARVRELGPHTELFFYFSGHGGDQALHASGARIDLARLEKILRQSGAQRVVLIIDACRTSGNALHAVDAREAMSNPIVEDGFVELQAAAVDEPAQESAALAGAIFTHYWIAGLRGAADSDHDGAVTLDEAYRFAAAFAHTANSAPLGDEVITRLSDARHDGDFRLTLAGVAPVLLGAVGGGFAGEFEWLHAHFSVGGRARFAFMPHENALSAGIIADYAIVDSVALIALRFSLSAETLFTHPAVIGGAARLGIVVGLPLGDSFSIRGTGEAGPLVTRTVTLNLEFSLGISRTF